MDGLSTVLGIIPIVIEIVKSYRIVRSRLSAFRHYPEVRHELGLRYRTEVANAEQNCRYLLQCVVDDVRASRMMQDTNHEDWKDPKLEERLKDYAEPNYTTMLGMFTIIKGSLGIIGEELGDISNIVKQWMQAVTWSRKENTIRGALTALDWWNEKLTGHLLMQHKIRKGKVPQPGGGLRQPVPSRYDGFRAASVSLHQSLQNKWPCTQKPQIDHEAKLCLDSNAEEEDVRLDMVFACHKTVVGANSDAASSGRRRWLQVKFPVSQSAISGPAVVPTGPVAASPGPVAAVPEPTNSVKQKFTKYKKKLTGKKVPNEDTSDDSNVPQEHHELIVQAIPAPDTLDLKTKDNICAHLGSNHEPPSNFVGYLENSSNERLDFYEAASHPDAQSEKDTPVVDLLADSDVSTELALAHNIAVATLMFYSTPWLGPDWRLQDISHFSDVTLTASDKPNQLPRLYLSTQVPSTAVNGLHHSTQNNSDLFTVYGIRNLALAKLGVALLEIASGREMERMDQSAPSTPADFVISARAALLEDRRSDFKSFSETYLKIAKQCLHVDFACGGEWDTDLREAVYTDVVCGLERMIHKWNNFLKV